jgi:hypothetical protein
MDVQRAMFISLFNTAQSVMEDEMRKKKMLIKLLSEPEGNRSQL